MDDEIVMYLVVRTELGMSPGKVAAQVGHGVQLAMRWAEMCIASGPDAVESPDELLEIWEGADYPKVVLGASDKQFSALHKTEPTSAAAWLDHPSVVVEDTGRTELKGNNFTVIAFCPARRSKMRPIVGHLGLYK